MGHFFVLTGNFFTNQDEKIGFSEKKDVFFVENG